MNLKKSDAGKTVKKEERILQTGFLSLVLVFVVLCLVVLSVLSLSTAVADSNLAKKSTDNVIEFYKADSLGEEWLKELNEKIIMSADLGMDEEYDNALKLYYREDFDTNTGIIKCMISINDRQELAIEAKRHERVIVDTGRKNYSIRLWKVLNTQEYVIDETVDVWSGGD